MGTTKFFTLKKVVPGLRRVPLRNWMGPAGTRRGAPQSQLPSSCQRQSFYRFTSGGPGRVLAASGLTPRIHGNGGGRGQAGALPRCCRLAQSVSSGFQSRRV